VTGDGELATVRMADGSVARLAPRSRLRLLPSPNERAVWIEGRVFFAAASNPARPFRVRTRAGDLVALGTRFDVRTEPRGLQLAVIEGRVAIIASAARTEVASGETAALRDGRTSAVVKIDDPDDVVGWMRRFLAFQSTPLANVASEIERVYGRKIVLADSSLGTETVTATFTDESFDRVVRVVCTVVGVECAVTDDQVTISR
jgi:transmembrane sensor